LKRARIDTAYSNLIDNHMKVLRSLTDAGSEITLFAQLIYEEIAELDPGRMRLIDANLDTAGSR
jgi:hypothetical protein